MEMKLGPWPQGIDNITQDGALPAEALRDALGVFIDTDGTVDTAPGFSQLAGSDGAHSIWTSPGGSSYCAVGDQLARLSLSGVQPFAQLEGFDPLSYCELNEKLVVSSRLQLSRLDGDTLVPLALPSPSCAARAVDRGGLVAGRYGVAVSLRRGAEESGLSPMRMLDVPAGGGIEIDTPDAGDSVSVYRTDANGGALYRALDAPPGMPGFLVGAGRLGAMPGTQFMEPLPGGQIVRSWMGRLLVARGRTLLYSSPLRYGLFRPSQDFVQLPSMIRMVLPVNDGVYIADSRRVYLLAGTNPDEWALAPLDMAPPPVGCGELVDGSLFEEIPAVPVACWLSGKGFALGLPEGQVVLAQEKRLRISIPERGWLVVDGHRLYAGG